MANKSLFESLVGKLIPSADVRNEEGAPAYSFSPKHALAQYAATGCFNSTFYAAAEEHLRKVVGLCAEVEPEFVAKAALYCREKGFMKDTPAFLCAYLAAKDAKLCGRVFPRVIDNAKMLRNFVQILRSGAVGRKSLGTAPKRLIREWLESRTDEAIFRGTAGNAPSLADVVKMVHPRPATPSREALYGYMIGKEWDAEALPEIVRRFEAFKAGLSQRPPDVPFQMLTGLPLGKEDWKEIARNGSWQMTRMNLNTFARHGVFEDDDLSARIAHRLSDRQEVRKAKAFPYQLLAAYFSTGKDIPGVVREALQDAMESAVENVPAFAGKVFVCLDVSGSMASPATGKRKGATSVIRCVDVAALVAAAIVRKNPGAEVIPFKENVVDVTINPRDSVMTNAAHLASIVGGGTNTSAPLALLNRRGAEGNLVLFVSDNQSWVDAGACLGTETMRQWNRFRKRNPGARMACIDIQPNGSTQAAEREDILNIGGFSDQVFEIVSSFATGELYGSTWVDAIEAFG